MTRALRLGALLLLASVVAACTAEAPAFVATAGSASSTAASAPGAAAEPGTDRGDGRPQVTYDGLMVRRRVVIAILPTPGADVDSLRKALDRAAAGLQTTLSDISPSVLDPAEQQRLAPDVTVVLPAGATLDDAANLIDPATSAAFPGVEDYTVAPVLVHDLRFTVSASNPSEMVAAIAREGILADALGAYSTSSGSGRLDITYTGPLLSDDLVELVRRGIARGEGAQPSSVTVSPRSTNGVGVDMAKEPLPAPVVEEEVAAPHGHGAAALPATAPVVAEPSQSSLWGVALVAVALWLIVMLVMLMRWNARAAD